LESSLTNLTFQQKLIIFKSMPEIKFTRTPAQLLSKRLTHIKFSQLIIEDLNKIKNQKRKFLKEEYLLNSYIINLVAFWQVFIEELVRYAVSNMTGNVELSKLSLIIERNCDERIKKFNTPNSENIDNLFKSVIGLENITNFLDQKADRRKIDEILQIRHSIAHSGKSPVKLNIASNFTRMETLMKAATKLENIVFTYITQ
jgi:hypothetical protein